MKFDFLTNLFKKKTSQVSSDMSNPDESVVMSPSEEPKTSTAQERRRKEKELEFVFRDFILDSQRIDKKDIKNYIYGKAFSLFRDDYYYGYTYKDGILTFIALNGGEHDIGKYSVFTPGILRPGKYFYKDIDSNQYYFLTNENGMCNVELGYDPRDGEGFENILDVPVRELPKTMKLDWSLRKSRMNVTSFLLLICLLSGLFFGFSLFKMKQAEETVQKNIANKPITLNKGANASKKLPEVVSVIKKVGDMVAGQGVIQKIEYSAQNKKLDFTIVFEQEFLAQSFIQKYGGRYENNKVIFSSDIIGSR